jgi:4-hydroxythreonine-4-phosphate dehydrogenase
VSTALALTVGEPAGIGPDITLQIAQHAGTRPLVAIADPGLLAARAKTLHLPIRLREIDSRVPDGAAEPGELYVQPVDLAAAVVPGELDPANSRYVLETIAVAARGCLADRFAAVVTAPVHKGVINAAGIAFSGHTEYLAELVGGHPVMLLTCPGLRVALATTHLPLRAVADRITPRRIRETLEVLERELRTRFKLARPRIAVCGLNPHAGEQGHLGTEEIEVIIPALDALRAQGMALTGPFPADTLFTPNQLQQVDAVLAMYHDQGLPVLKHMGFGQAVNVTLGLPIVRTSVDHGTALDLAGSGRADPGSLNAALRLAAELTDR